MKKMTNLQRIRKEKGLSQHQLADISGVDFKKIQKYEQRYRDINNAKAITVYTLSIALECNIKDLLEIESE